VKDPHLTTAQFIAQLREIGGCPWKAADGTQRVYFNDLPDLFGLELVYYKSGNIKSAKLDGDRISNTTARRICGDLATLKLWVDPADGTTHVRHQFRPIFDYDYHAILTEAVCDRLAEVPCPAPD
jgi:hypothetical protein